MARVAKRSREADSVFRTAIKNFNLPGMRPVKCLVCGQVLDVLTHVHAAKHGYGSKEEFVQAGMIKVVGA